MSARARIILHIKLSLSRQPLEEVNFPSHVIESLAGKPTNGTLLARARDMTIYPDKQGCPR